MFLQLNLPFKPSVCCFQLLKFLLVSIGNNILTVDLSHPFLVLLQLIVQRLDLISRVLVRLFAILHFFFGDLSTVDVILNLGYSPSKCFADSPNSRGLSGSCQHLQTDTFKGIFQCAYTSYRTKEVFQTKSSFVGVFSKFL